MGPDASPEEPFVVAVGESEEDSPAAAHPDEAHEDSEHHRSAPEAQQRASAAAAYGKAAHGGSRRPGPQTVAAREQELRTDSAGVETDVEQLEQDLSELTAKAELADEYLQLAQRTQADFENYRKRAAREAALAQERGIARLAKELLPAIDNLERAVAAAAAVSATAGEDAPEAAAQETPAVDTQMLDGLKLVHAEVVAALARVGIETFAPLGEQFDPQHHEAVAQHRVEGAPAGTVIEVYQQGYRLGDAVLRPARVLVAA